MKLNETLTSNSLLNYDSDKNSDSSHENEISVSNQKKYSFDVVEDPDPLSISTTHISSVQINENKENVVDDPGNHKRIVRVSLQKQIRKLHEICFQGNDRFVLYRDDLLRNGHYQNSVNIRFKTIASNGLLFLTLQKHISGSENIFALSVEDGFMHLRFNYGTKNMDIKYNETKVADGLWHRVRAFR